MLLTNEVQFKAFTGVIRIADKLKPHGVGGGVQGGVEQLAACKHPQQTSLITAAIKDLERTEGEWEELRSGHKKDMLTRHTHGETTTSNTNTTPTAPSHPEHVVLFQSEVPRP